MSAPAQTPYKGEPGNGPLGNHPQRAKIIDAILNRESDVSITRWVAPRVSRAVVARLRVQVLREYEAARILEQAKQLQAAAGLTAPIQQDAKQVARLAAAGSEHLLRIRKHQERLDSAMENVDPATLATLVKTDLQGIRLAAELDGSLATAGTQTVENTFNVVMLPGAPSEPEGEVIDVQADTL